MERWTEQLEELARRSLPEAVHRYIRQGARDGVSAAEAVEAVRAAGSEHLGHTEMLGALTGVTKQDTMFVVASERDGATEQHHLVDQIGHGMPPVADDVPGDGERARSGVSGHGPAGVQDGELPLGVLGRVGCAPHQHGERTLWVLAGDDVLLPGREAAPETVPATARTSGPPSHFVSGWPSTARRWRSRCTTAASPSPRRVRTSPRDSGMAGSR